MKSKDNGILSEPNSLDYIIVLSSFYIKVPVHKTNFITKTTQHTTRHTENSATGNMAYEHSVGCDMTYGTQHRTWH
jgi:hypothetical protein